MSSQDNNPRDADESSDPLDKSRPIIHHGQIISVEELETGERYRVLNKNGGFMEIFTILSLDAPDAFVLGRPTPRIEVRTEPGSMWSNRYRALADYNVVPYPSGAWNDSNCLVPFRE